MTSISDVLFADLRLKRKIINRLLRGGLIFAFFGQFYVLEPYFQYKQEERMAEEIQGKTQILPDNARREATRIRKVSGEARSMFERIQKRIAQYPDHLRGVMPNIRDAIVSDHSSRTVQRRSRRPVGDFLDHTQIMVLLYTTLIILNR